MNTVLKTLTLGFLSAVLFNPGRANAQNSLHPHLNHIAIYVVDLKTATEFYRDILGLETIPEPFHDGRHTWFRVGPNSHLHLIQGAATKEVHDKNSHLCFSIDAVDTFIKILNSHKIAFEDWTGNPGQVTNRVDGVKQLYFRDPDGYWIEINDAKE